MQVHIISSFICIKLYNYKAYRCLRSLALATSSYVSWDDASQTAELIDFTFVFSFFLSFFFFFYIFRQTEGLLMQRKHKTLKRIKPGSKPP